MIRYASPTFLFRHRCPQDMDAIMARLKACGFDGIELYGMFGHSTEALQALCRKHDLSIACDHIHFEEFSAHTEAVIRSRVDLGAQYLTIDNIPEDRLPGTPLWQGTVAELSRIGAACQAQGVQLLYHSHGYDITRKVDGTPVLDYILEDTDPSLLQFQPDLGWLQLGGADPEVYLDRYRDRCPIIHLKDYFSTAPVVLESPFLLGEKRGGPVFQDFEFRPSGYGVMNFPQLMPKVLSAHPRWITTDHDMSYERNTFSDMAMSLRYVKELVALYPIPAD